MSDAAAAHRAYLACFGERQGGGGEGGRGGREFLENWERGEDSWEGVVMLLNGLPHDSIVEK